MKTRRTSNVQFTVVNSSQIYVDVCLQHNWCQSQYFSLPFTITTDHPSGNPKAKGFFKCIFLFLWKPLLYPKNWCDSQKKFGKNRRSFFWKRRRFPPGFILSDFHLDFQLDFRLDFHLDLHMDLYLDFHLDFHLNFHLDLLSDLPPFSWTDPDYCITRKCSNQVAIVTMFANNNIYYKVSNVFTGFKVNATS